MNNIKEERLQILKMIEEGKISSSEAAELLGAIDENTDLVSNKKAKWLKIRVYEGNNKSKVNVNIPISLVKFGLKIANKYGGPEASDSLKDLDFDEIMEAVKNGAQGKIVEVHDEEKGEKVEVYVE